MTAQEVRTYIGYSGWASRKVLEAALALPPEDRAKPMSVSHESIANTLAHIYFGDAIWFSRTADQVGSLGKCGHRLRPGPSGSLPIALCRQRRPSCVADRGARGEPRYAAPRPNRRRAASAWREAAGDGHFVLLLRTSRACRLAC